jgi:hypothetical protein
MINTFLGMAIAMTITQVSQGALGYKMPLLSNIGLTALITAASIFRGYIVRRFFANGMHRMVKEFVRGLKLGEPEDVIEHDLELDYSVEGAKGMSCKNCSYRYKYSEARGYTHYGPRSCPGAAKEDT